MDRVEHVKPNFPVDAFAGTADYYVRYRVPYSRALLRDLVGRSGAKGNGRLLDLACGPGRVALALASSFQEAWAIDLEPEMIEAARREAAKRGVTGIRWLVGRAEGLEAPPAYFDLITIGEAFHRLDQQLVADRALGWLRPGGCLATLGCYSILSAREPWQRIVLDIVQQWTSRAHRNANGAEPKGPGVGPAHDECVLCEAGFLEVASHLFVEPHEWTIDTILGYLYSTSVCSKANLGGGAGPFESDLKTALLAFDPGGTYRENIQWGYTFGRKPC